MINYIFKKRKLLFLFSLAVSKTVYPADVTNNDSISTDDNFYTYQVTSDLDNFINNGTLENSYINGYSVYILGRSISNLKNTGIIRTYSPALDAIYFDTNSDNFKTITLLNNYGELATIYGARYGIYNYRGGGGSGITTLTNSGLIHGGTYGIYNHFGSLTTLNNSGLISGGIALQHTSSRVISEITNTGTFNGSSGGDIRIGSEGTLTTLNNSQGGLDALTYQYYLPDNYNIIVNNSDDYGKIIFSSVSGDPLTFGIYSTSNLEYSTTYTDVISGLASQYLSNTSGTFTASSGLEYDWTLQQQISGAYNLVIGVCDSGCPTTYNAIPDNGLLATTNAIYNNSASRTGAITATAEGVILNNSGVLRTTDGNSTISFSNLTDAPTINNTGTLFSNVTTSGYLIDSSNSSGIDIINDGDMIAYYGAINLSESTVRSIVNNDTITVTFQNNINLTDSTVTSFSNTGTINDSRGTRSIKLSSNSGTSKIINFSNSGTISGGVNIELLGDSSIVNLTNTGSLTSPYAGGDNIRLQTTNGGITSITNTGTMSAPNGYNIYNDPLFTSSINELNNQQDDLTYYGIIPINYNVIISSTTDFGKIIFSTPSGSMNFGITSGSTVAESQTYLGVIDGLTSANLNYTSGTFTDSSNSQTYNWTLNNSSGNLWDLVFSSCTNCYPSAASTQTTINNISYGMSAQMASFAMTTNFANLNTYDCGLFDAKGGCFSVGGRFTDVNANNNSDSDSSAIVMVGGYKINDHVRIAGFADQMVNNNTPSGIDMENKNPMVGLSLVWNQHPDHLGYQVKLANAYQDKDVTITRTATGDAEAGSGSTDVSVQSYIAEVSYQFLSNEKTAYRPYFAGRYAKIKQDGYTETNVDNPLTYSTVEDESVTLIMGMKVKHALSPEIYLNGSLGVEHDIHNDVDNLNVTATNISSLSPVSVNSNINKTRGVASLGADYYLAKNQMLSLKTQFQELAYTHTNAKTAYLSYTIGF